MAAIFESDFDRLLRFQDARRVFRRLFPGLGWARAQKLIDLAVDYWERPERFA